MSNPKVKLLTIEHLELTNKFKCGNKFLDQFLTYEGVYYGNTGEARTHILVNYDESQIIAYCTLKCSSIKVFNEKDPERPILVPAVEISRFATHETFQDQGNGKLLLAYALDLIRTIKETMAGVKIVIVFARNNEKVIGFYKGFEFEEASGDMDIYCIPENDDCIPMFLLI